MKAECSCCEYYTDVTRYEDEDMLLCDVCAHTFLSRRYKGVSQGEEYLMQSLGYIANMLLDEIRKLKG